MTWRRGIDAVAEPGRAPGTWRLRRAITRPGLVSVIMPTAGRGGLVRQAITTLRATAGRPIEIVVLDNIPASNKAMKAWVVKHADRVVEMRGKFNWSRFNNEGAAASTGEYLLFLNDDIEARQAGWLDALLEYAQLPEIGVVGARLLYPDGKVQHGGQYLADGYARHAFRFADGRDLGPFGLAVVAREMTSVTGACQLVRRDVFDRLGRFHLLLGRLGFGRHAHRYGVDGDLGRDLLPSRLVLGKRDRDVRRRWRYQHVLVGRRRGWQ